jgi:hypothetical protein
MVLSTPWLNEQGVGQLFARFLALANMRRLPHQLDRARRPRRRGKTMIILNRDGTLECIAGGWRSGDTRRDSIDLPIDLVAQHHDLFDRVFALAFDVLALATVELRVRAAGQETLS